jgi:hypothetical protein
MTLLEKTLRDFAQLVAKLKGDERNEAQTFLFHLLAVFGHDANALPEGSTFEYRVRAGRCAGVDYFNRGLVANIDPIELTPPELGSLYTAANENNWDYILRDLYRALETLGTNRLRDAHAALDSAVRDAYSMKDDADIFAFMLAPNLELVDKEAKGEEIIPPGSACLGRRTSRVYEHGLRNSARR